MARGYHIGCSGLPRPQEFQQAALRSRSTIISGYLDGAEKLGGGGAKPQTLLHHHSDRQKQKGIVTLDVLSQFNFESGNGGAVWGMTRKISILL